MMNSKLGCSQFEVFLMGCGRLASNRGYSPATGRQEVTEVIDAAADLAPDNRRPIGHAATPIVVEGNRYSGHGLARRSR